jgi:molybdate transport system ATP-binding protein
MSVEIALKDRLGDFSLDAAFVIERPGITALFGPSGAGKTTIVNAVAGLYTPAEGRIVINGRIAFDRALGVRLAARARRVGYVFQDSRLFPHMPVLDNLLFGWRRAAAPAQRDEIERVVELLGIRGLLGRWPRHLSGGEKQRVALGRALLSGPELLLLDEPMASLDPARRAEILPYLERLRTAERLPMLYVSHAIEEVGRLADEVVVLERGRVRAQGPVFDILPGIDPSAGTVLPVTVLRHRDDGLSELAFPGGVLLVRKLASETGATLRVRIAAADVMIALSEPKDVSANNVIKSRIVALQSLANELVDVRLVCGASKLVARITRASAARLALAEGLDVFAVIKAVTVDAPLRTD